MDRVSTNMTNDDMQYYLQLRNSQMNTLQNQMAEGTKIKNLRDDPVSAAHSVKYLSKILWVKTGLPKAIWLVPII